MKIFKKNIIFHIFYYFLVERAIDASRQYRKIPSEESSHLALLTNVEFQRNPDCKLMGLS